MGFESACGFAEAIFGDILNRNVIKKGNAMFARGGGQRIEGRAACSIVLVILGACSVGGGKNATALPDVAVARVHRADLSRTLVLTAEFRPFQDIDVHAKVAGFVKSILVDVGSRVKTGDLLAVLEIPELRDELHQTAASVHQSEEDVERAKAEIRQAESAYEVAHLGFTRLAGVAKSRPDLVAQQDLDDATGRDRVSEAQVATANASLAAAIAHLQEARANRARVQSLFDYSRIVAPFTGVVTKRYADTGSMIQAGTSSQTQAMPLVRLAQNDLLRLVIPVPESVVPSIRLGSPIEVQVPALRKNFTGSVARFADKVDMSTRTMHTEHRHHPRLLRALHAQLRPAHRHRASGPQSRPPHQQLRLHGTRAQGDSTGAAAVEHLHAIGRHDRRGLEPGCAGAH